MLAQEGFTEHDIDQSSELLSQHTDIDAPGDPRPEPSDNIAKPKQFINHQSLKYHLLGPSATKAGLALDQSKISEIIYEASKGSKFFQREEQKDKLLTQKIAHLKQKASSLPKPLLAKHTRDADVLLLSLEAERDLSQHIVHVDCDAFFAAVEELDRPELKDVPFAVGKGVLTTANYHARKFGCRSGMASFVAKKLCPHLILISNNFQKYNTKAEEVREVLVDFDPRFESASIDEAYLNITAYCQENNVGPEDAVKAMREAVAERTKVTVSAGIAANARIAKICSNVHKPNGQFSVLKKREAIMKFIGDLPTRKVNGIGRVLERELAGAISVHKISDLYEKRGYLVPLFGEKTAHFLLRVYLGLGRTNVQPAQEYERKSVGTERTFSDLSNPESQRQQLRATAEALEQDLAKRQVKGRTLVLKVKLHTYEVLTRQIVALHPLSLADDLYNHAVPILSKLQSETPNMTLRLMGLRCTNLVSTKKPDTAAFFNVKSRDGSILSPKFPEADDDGWEKWPEEELGPLERPKTPEEYGKGKAIISDEPLASLPEPREQTPAKEPWNCPVCLLPQKTDQKLFNEHIDLCLSRQTIRDAVRETSLEPVGIHRSANKISRHGNSSDKKRSRSVTIDPKQKKLCFG